MKYFTTVLLSILLTLPTAHKAFSFPFITVAKGELQPDLKFAHFDSDGATEFTQETGQANLFIFWGADYPETKLWSVDTLKQFQADLPFYQARNIHLHAVDIQNSPDSIVREVIQKSAITYPTYLDIDENAFQELGVHTIPCVLLVDDNGKIVLGMGYSYRLSEMVTSAISILRNEKTEEEIQQELHPETELKDPTRAAAETHYYYGVQLIERDMLEEAAQSFKVAIDTDPGFADPHIELGCILLEIGNSCEADMYLEKGTSLAPDSSKGRRCLINLSKEELHGCMDN